MRGTDVAAGENIRPLLDWIKEVTVIDYILLRNNILTGLKRNTLNECTKLAYAFWSIVVTS